MVTNSVYFASALGLAPLTWLLGILEPAVAGYAPRLYRILGSRAAWWVFTTFSLLALGHEFHASGASRFFGSSVMFDVVMGLVPFLLLIGMVHTESALVTSVRTGRTERELQAKKESETQQKITELVQETEELRNQVA